MVKRDVQTEPYTVRIERKNRETLKDLAKAMNQVPGTAAELRRWLDGIRPSPSMRKSLLRRHERVLLRVSILERRVEHLEVRMAQRVAQVKLPKTDESIPLPEPDDTAVSRQGPESIRRAAEELVSSINPETGDVYTRAEIEATLIRLFGISRNKAQSHSRRAVSKLDPENPKRRTHKMGIGRRVTDAQKREMSELYQKGLTLREVARRMNADERTVSIHLGRRKTSKAKFSTGT